MKLGKKILIVCLSLILFAVAEYVIYYIVHYVNFRDYKDTLTTYEVEAGKDYKPEKAKAKDDFDLITSSDVIELYANASTGEIAVYNKVTKEWYNSTPDNVDTDPIANADNISRLKSQLILTYFNSNRNEGIYTTDHDVFRISPDQLEVQSIDNGVRFIYHFKPKETSDMVVPYVMEAERFEGFLAKMSEKSQRDLKTSMYEYDEDDDVWHLRDALLSDNSGQTRMFDKIKKYFYDEAGYTTEDYILDMEDSGYELRLPANFKVALEYRVEDNGLVVNIPTSEIQETSGNIYTLELLPGFGSATMDEEGYFVVPNGSGSIINFNNGKKETYAAYVYGIDPVSADYTKVENTENARLPLYAMCRNKSAMLAVIENGASLGQINAMVSGQLASHSSYNVGYFRFFLRGSESLGMFGTTGESANIPIVEKKFADCNIQVRYNFLDENYKGYNGVAKFYREQLEKNGVLTANGEATSKDVENIGFYYDLIGGVKVTDFFLGVRYLGVQPMTTFKQAREIAEALEAAGIKDQIINYQGWFNGGYYHDVADKVKMISKLGSKGSFEDLASYVEGLGGKVYGDVAFQKVTDISKRYKETNEAARYYAGYTVTLGQVNPTTLRQTAPLGYRETLYSIISPKFLVRYVDKYLDKTGDLDITGNSLRDLGDVLSSDKRRTEVINREEALQIVKAQLKKFADAEGKDVMISGGNDYAVPYADDMINVPIGENRFFSVDAEIPFYEMIYHGYVDYASYNINTSDTYEVDDIALRLIEYGASPHFVFTKEESNEMKYTGLNGSYSTTFDTWKDTSIEIYNKVNDALKYVKNATMVDHEILDDGVREVTYSNGVSIIINTTKSDVSVGGQTIAAMSYVVKGVN